MLRSPLPCRGSALLNELRVYDLKNGDRFCHNLTSGGITRQPILTQLSHRLQNHFIQQCQRPKCIDQKPITIEATGDSLLAHCVVLGISGGFDAQTIQGRDFGRPIFGRTRTPKSAAIGSICYDAPCGDIDDDLVHAFIYIRGSIRCQ